jgi:hypothetical protein
MKKIIGMVIASLLFCSVAFALVSNTIVRFDDHTSSNKGKYSIATVCVDGSRFVVALTGKNGISVEQFFEMRDGISLPAMC